MAERKREGKPLPPEAIKEFFDRLIPQPCGLKVFAHGPRDLDITVARLGSLAGTDQDIGVTVRKRFGEPTKISKSEVELKEIFLFHPQRNSVTHGIRIMADSLLGVGTEIYVSRDHPFEEIDFANMDKRNQRMLQDLVRVIQESVRVTPYTGEPLPYDEETDADRQLADNITYIDKTMRQVSGALREGFNRITVETDFDDKGIAHGNVIPEE